MISKFSVSSERSCDTYESSSPKKRVAATVSGPEKADFVHGLGAEYAINYREEDLVEAVIDWTEGRGVDVALDTVGPDVFARTIPAMAYYGDLITILQPGPDVD